MTHGLTITESTTSNAVTTASTLSTIGVIVTGAAAAGADTTALNAAFPLDTPVLVTDITTALASLPASTTGTILATLTAISQITSPIMVVVRVEAGDDQAETDANVIGAVAGNAYTGIQALLAAQQRVGKTPRILGAPGLDSEAVTAALVIAAKKLRAMVYAAVHADDEAEALVYRAEFGASQLMLIWPDSSTSFSGDAIARALALRALIDEEQGWHKTISNVVVDGISAITRDVHWDLLDSSTTAGVLNDAGITTMIQHDGWRFWGNRTCAGNSEPQFVFESARRTSYALQDLILSIVFPYIDKPMTLGLVKALLEKINATLTRLTQPSNGLGGQVIGARVALDSTKNTAAQLAAGKPVFTLTYTPAAPLENPIVEFVSSDEYYEGFADQLG
jgi:uncharacterized protein